jgi:hypothetical protein
VVFWFSTTCCWSSNLMIACEPMPVVMVEPEMTDCCGRAGLLPTRTSPFMSMMVPAAKAWTLATSAAAAKALRMLRSLVMLSSLLSSFAGHGPGWLTSF